MNPNITLETLMPFCSRLETRTQFHFPFIIHRGLAHGGDGSQTWEDKMEIILGAETIERLHYDTVATDGAILVWVPAQRTQWCGDGPVGFGFQREMADALRHPTRLIDWQDIPALPDSQFYHIDDKDKPFESLEPEWRVQRVTIGNTDFAERYLRKIRDCLPNPKICPTPWGSYDKLKFLLFKFDGGRGILAALRPEKEGV
jgi:hypothetical protein